jgi:hypothetical protein
LKRKLLHFQNCAIFFLLLPQTLCPSWIVVTFFIIQWKLQVYLELALCPTYEGLQHFFKTSSTLTLVEFAATINLAKK